MKTCNFLRYAGENKSKEFLESIRNISNMSNLSWCLIGDMNDMLSIKDKNRGVVQPQWVFDDFKEVVSECGLHEIEMEGYLYT